MLFDSLAAHSAHLQKWAALPGTRLTDRGIMQAVGSNRWSLSILIWPRVEAKLQLGEGTMMLYLYGHTVTMLRFLQLNNVCIILCFCAKSLLYQTKYRVDHSCYI